MSSGSRIEPCLRRGSKQPCSDSTKSPYSPSPTPPETDPEVWPQRAVQTNRQRFHMLHRGPNLRRLRRNHRRLSLHRRNHHPAARAILVKYLANRDQRGLRIQRIENRLPPEAGPTRRRSTPSPAPRKPFFTQSRTSPRETTSRHPHRAFDSDTVSGPIAPATNLCLPVALPPGPPILCIAAPGVVVRPPSPLSIGSSMIF